MDKCSFKHPTNQKNDLQYIHYNIPYLQQNFNILFRFVREEELVQFKIFKRDDEPTTRGLTPEEQLIYVKKYSEELKQRNSFTADEIKHLESQMEGRSHLKMLNTVDAVKEQIAYVRPFRLNKDQLEQEIIPLSLERDLQQDRILSKMFAYYHKDIDIPKEPTYAITNLPNPAKVPRLIALEIPSNQDLLSVVTMICQNKEKEAIQEMMNKKSKPLKGILRKAYVEIADEDDQSKADIQPMIHRLYEILQNRQMYQSNELFSLINDIMNKLKDSGKPQCIMNISTIINGFLTTDKVQQQDQQIQSQQRVEQQRFMQNNRQQQQFQRQPYIPQQQIQQQPYMNNNQYPQQQRYPAQPQQQMFVKAYKTKPCINFHSEKGCYRAQNCNFIHDQQFQGVPIPGQFPPPPMFKRPTMYQSL